MKDALKIFLQAIKRNDKSYFLLLRICFNKKLLNFEDMEVKNLDYYNSYDILRSVLFYLFL